MKIQLKFFASVREKLGVAAETLELADADYSADDIRQVLIARGGVWAEALANGRALRMAYMQVMVNGDVQVCDGGELAFFPPVTGG